MAWSLSIDGSDINTVSNVEIARPMGSLLVFETILRPEANFSIQS
ncbi:uncharacterized protein FTOL_01908 [Fusarium torulosum]|uniref:Uncharacterized protein n=1 Tax=Fusarium torulosum TaxID=33205 RepID=A0AAE8SDT7_9HYPO|nr:uncharacterized protein FTOL_01908 [Fusarium torulosum]